MFKFLVLGLVLYVAYKFFNLKELPSKKEKAAENIEAGPSSRSSDEYVDYEELE